MINIQIYTVAEAIGNTFDINLITVGVAFTVLLYLLIAGGVPSLGKTAAKIVPFMILFYLGGGLFIILKHADQLPHAFGLIFGNAFTGTAAVGGFAGAAFSQAIKMGMARSVFSNEAGWGSAPMIHASAKVDHPVKQGILGVFLFGITTSSGIYAQMEVVVRYLIGDNKKKDIILSLYKWLYPIPSLALVFIAVYYQFPGTSVWLFSDASTALPIFANVMALVILSPKFIELLKDYKARYMGIGKVDPNFRIFYEDNDGNSEYEESAN